MWKSKVGNETFESLIEILEADQFESYLQREAFLNKIRKLADNDDKKVKLIDILIAQMEKLWTSIVAKANQDELTEFKSIVAKWLSCTKSIWNRIDETNVMVKDPQSN